MAQRKKQQPDVMARLEDALHKLADMPGSAKVLEAVHGVRERLDDLQGRIRSLDPLERRVAALERRLDELAGPSKTRRKPAASKTTRTKTSTARKPAAKKTSS